MFTRQFVALDLLALVHAILDASGLPNVSFQQF